MQRDTVVARYAIALVARERQRQLAVEGWSEAHDDALTGGELGLAAACYAAAPHPLYTGSPEAPVDAWPFAPAQDKRGRHDTVRRLAIAGALLLACAVSSVVLWADSSEIFGSLIAKESLAVVLFGAVSLTITERAVRLWGSYPSSVPVGPYSVSLNGANFSTARRSTSAAFILLKAGAIHRARCSSSSRL